MAEGLADVEVGTSYRTSALKVRGTVFACIASHRSAEPDTLVAVVSFDDRDQLLEEGIQPRITSRITTSITRPSSSGSARSTGTRFATCCEWRGLTSRPKTARDVGQPGAGNAARHGRGDHVC